ncbi:MAG: hypothetical protein NW226_14255 [Microscillaceae bacterium]|nr:hypothetical protein [Microscillaceae bacterium]
MEQLSSLGIQKLEDLASQYGLSLDAVKSLMYSVRQGNGTQAQFNHPELGGMGQWMKGGMIMVGDMFNNQLKYTVANVCDRLSDFIYEPSYWLPKSVEQSSMSGFSGNWWPSAYGEPTSVGSQNEFAYALFSARKRLAIKQNDKITLYDTLDYVIHGFSQQQGSNAPQLKMSTYHGEIGLEQLQIVTE